MSKFLLFLAAVFIFVLIIACVASIKPVVVQDIFVSRAPNIGVVPSCWRVGESWCAPTFIDYSVFHNGNCSIRMERGLQDKSREILAANFSDTDWAINVKPGDQIIFIIWMKTGASTINDNSASAGVRFGIDLSNNHGRITAVQTPNGSYWTPQNGYPTNQAANYVQWGSDWTRRIMNFTIQSTYPTDGLLGGEKGILETPSSMVPWVQVWSETNSNRDEGTAWFADVELYIT
jgi:hypothetical protein